MTRPSASATSFVAEVSVSVPTPAFSAVSARTRTISAPLPSTWWMTGSSVGRTAALLPSGKARPAPAANRSSLRSCRPARARWRGPSGRTDRDVHEPCVPRRRSRRRALLLGQLGAPAAQDAVAQRGVASHRARLLQQRPPPGSAFTRPRWRPRSPAPRRPRPPRPPPDSFPRPGRPRRPTALHPPRTRTSPLRWSPQARRRANPLRVAALSRCCISTPFPSSLPDACSLGRLPW